MENIAITPAEFKNLLPRLCGRETSYDKKQWSESNPLCGHCAIVAVLAQEIFGGLVHWAKITLPGEEKPVSHYWNILPDGMARDFTKSQFKDNAFSMPRGSNITNNITFLRIKNSKRYNIFAKKFFEAIK